MTGFSSHDLHQHAGAMRRLARDLLRDSSLADDAVQQAYVTAIERPPARTARLAGWLLSVVRSCASDLQRSEARRHRREHAVAKDGDDTSLTPRQTAERFEVQAAIVAAVRGLGEPYTTTVWLRYYEDLSPTEIAVRLGVSVKTTKTRLRRALHQLRARLDEGDGGRPAWLAAIAPIAQVPLGTNLGAASAAGVLLMQGKMLAAAAAILVATGSLLWLSSPATPATGIAATNAPQAAVVAARAPSSTPATPGIAVPERNVVESTIQVAADPSVPVPPIEILVLRSDTRTPIHDAKVGYLQREPARSELTDGDLAAWRRDSWDFYQSWGTVLRTDPQGLCTLANRPEQFLSVVIASEDHFAKVYIGPEQTERITVLLSPDRQIAVTVLNADGSPAPAVDLLMAMAGEAKRVVKLGPTGVDGRLHIFHSQTYPRPGERTMATFTAVGASARSTPVDVDLVTGRGMEEVVLWMPASGTITLELRSESGVPYVFLGSSMPTVEYAFDQAKPPFTRDHPDIQHGRLASDGRLVLRHVAFDTHYSLRVRGFQREALIGKGPTAELPNVVVPVVAPDSLVILKARAVDSGGTPMANTKIGIRLRWDRGGPYSEYLTDDQGVLMVAVESLQAGTSVDMIGTFRRPNPSPAIRDGGKTVLLTSTIALGHVVSAGVNDLGDASFGEGELVMTGILVVPKGLEDLDRVSWVVERQSEAGPEVQWEAGTNCFTTWGKDRSFEIRSPVKPQGKLRLRFQPGAYRAMAPLEFIPGTEDLEIRLDEAGSVTAEILDDVEADGEPRIVAKLVAEQPATPQSQSATRTRVQVIAQGRLRAKWSGLEPGLYSLVLETKDSGEQILKIGGIRVTQGEAEDPRLDAVDLRSRIRSVRIRVVDPMGKPVTMDGVRVLIAQAEGEGWTEHRLERGALELCVVNSLKLRVLAPGYRLAAPDQIHGDTEIRLEAATALRLRVQWPFELPEGVWAAIHMTPRNADYATKGVAQGSLDQASQLRRSARVDCEILADGSAVARPAVEGLHSLSLRLMPGGYEDSFCLSPRTVEVMGQEPTEVTLKVDAVRLRRALANLPVR